MPTYEYACRSCGSQIEVVQSFTDDPLTTCGECGGPLRKVFSAVGISFKGSGFYKTDSRSGSGSRTATEPAAAKSTDTKPAETTAAPAGDSGSSAGGSSAAKPAAASPSTS